MWSLRGIIISDISENDDNYGLPFGRRFQKFLENFKSNFTLWDVFGHISLNYCPIFKIQKLAYTGERACHQENHGCRQNSLSVVTGDDMTTKKKHCTCPLWREINHTIIGVWRLFQNYSGVYGPIKLCLSSTLWIFYRSWLHIWLSVWPAVGQGRNPIGKALVIISDLISIDNNQTWVLHSSWKEMQNEQTYQPIDNWLGIQAVLPIILSYDDNCEGPLLVLTMTRYCPPP